MDFGNRNSILIGWAVRAAKLHKKHSPPLSLSSKRPFSSGCPASELRNFAHGPFHTGFCFSAKASVVSFVEPGNLIDLIIFVEGRFEGRFDAMKPLLVIKRASHRVSQTPILVSPGPEKLLPSLENSVTKPE